MTLQSVLIANRGEIAVRIIRACRLQGIYTIAIFSSDDTHSLHVKMADECFSLGSGSVQETYLNIPKILEILDKSNADAVHPGYGFLSENAEFAKAVEASGKIFIGPKSEIIDYLGDKIKAKNIAREVGLPVVPGSTGFVHTFEEAKQIAEDIGYPIIIKSAFGGGGRGMERVNSVHTLRSAFEGCQAISEQFFGRKEVFIEKFIKNPRHIEIQFIGDHFGNVIHLGDRECSIQRSNQKLIEEAPSFLDRNIVDELGEKVCDLAKNLGYVNAGTAEFLWKDNHLYFNEINPRIQVEHPVTEMITGIDLVVEQLKVAAGEPLSYKQDEISFQGHAIEFRINAEDPYAQNLPQSGKITQVIIPGGSNVRFDTFIYPQYSIPNHFDSLVGKLIVWGKNREQAILMARNALKELTISGVKTNIELHQAIIETREYQQWLISTGFLNQINITKILRNYEYMKIAAISQVFELFNISQQNIVPEVPKNPIRNMWRESARREQVR
ncbi:MAG: acetyl-CoA carboxylase biotin carboxylase subunit [Candidatus Lokiarchaeota archaeon]|nr:acetyl-CoA carboxylase biotin carboxylase subunit [Candidatus Harpocratesius repetitus]